MLKVRVKIGTGNIVDTEDTYGLVYLDSDKRFAADTKGFEATSYAEDEGEHIIPRSVDAPFDYKVKFFVRATDVSSANDKIKTFNEALYDYQVVNNVTTKVKIFKPVVFYNDYKQQRIAGYPKPISEATDFWRDPNHTVNDVVIVEWTIRVTKPSDCEYKKPFSDDSRTN